MLRRSLFSVFIRLNCVLSHRCVRWKCSVRRLTLNATCSSFKRFTLLQPLSLTLLPNLPIPILTRPLLWFWSLRIRLACCFLDVFRFKTVRVLMVFLTIAISLSGSRQFRGEAFRQPAQPIAPHRCSVEAWLSARPKLGESWRVWRANDIMHNPFSIRALSMRVHS